MRAQTVYADTDLYKSKACNYELKIKLRKAINY